MRAFRRWIFGMALLFFLGPYLMICVVHLQHHDGISTQSSAMMMESFLDLPSHNNHMFDCRWKDPKNNQTLPKSSRAVEENMFNDSLLRESGRQTIRYYTEIRYDRQPRRHLRFSDLTFPKDMYPGGDHLVPQDATNMYTTHMQTSFHQVEHMVQKAPWFLHHKYCHATCCATPLAMSFHHEQHRIINTVDGQDIAEVLVHGTVGGRPSYHEFAGVPLDLDLLPCLRPGVIIHVDNLRTAMTYFVNDLLPNLRVPFVLWTTKSDFLSPNTYNGQTQQLLDDPRLLAWYGTNPSYDKGAHHAKFRMVPLGLPGRGHGQVWDFQVLHQARHFANPFGGDQTRWTTTTHIPHSSRSRNTTPWLFVNFGINKYSSHRQAKWNMACQDRPPLDDVSCTNVTTDHRRTYHAASKYWFGLSPKGSGNDCYRTYELLLSGIVPVLDYLDETQELLYDLPFVALKRWDYRPNELLDVLEAYLQSPQFLNRTFDEGWKRLFFHYWRHQTLQDAGRLAELVQDDQGNAYHTFWSYSKYEPPR